MGAPNFSRDVYFCQQYFFLRRGKRKKSEGLYQGYSVNVLEHRPLFLPKTTSHFRPCDLRHCYVLNK